MNIGGWIMMIVSCGLVTALTVYCFAKVLTSRDPAIDEELRAPLDIDTRDRER